MTMDAVCDVFGGVHLAVEDGELLLSTPDVLRILELEASEVLVPLDEICEASGDMSVTYADESTVRGLVVLSRSNMRDDFMRWLDMVAIPLHETVKAYGEGLKRFRSEGA